MFDFLVRTANAMPPAGQGGQQPDPFLQFAPFILIILVFYFLVIRPQSKRAKEQRKLIENLKKGDEVYTSSGLRGTIQRVAETEIHLEVAPKVTIRILKQTVTELVKAGKGGGDKEEKVKEVEDKDE